jgi:hypothetical protein
VYSGWPDSAHDQRVEFIDASFPIYDGFVVWESVMLALHGNSDLVFPNNFKGPRYRIVDGGVIADGIKAESPQATI